MRLSWKLMCVVVGGVLAGCGEPLPLEESELQVGTLSAEAVGAGDPIVAYWKYNDSVAFRAYADGSTVDPLGFTCAAPGGPVFANITFDRIEGNYRYYRADRYLACPKTWKYNVSIRVWGSGPGSSLHEPYGTWYWVSW